MDTHTDYKDGTHEEFITFLFTKPPQEKGSIKLELPLSDDTKNKHHHIFEQLLMIFVDGLKYLHGDNQGKVSIEYLTTENINIMNQYFESFNYTLLLSIYPTIYDYQFKYPNYLKHPEIITNETTLMDFFYEIFGQDNIVFRIQFNYVDI